MKKINDTLGFSVAAFHARQRKIALSHADTETKAPTFFIQTTYHNACWLLPQKSYKPVSLIIPPKTP